MYMGDGVLVCAHKTCVSLQIMARYNASRYWILCNITYWLLNAG